MLPLYSINSDVLYADEGNSLFGDWGGVKTSLEESGVSVEGVVIGDLMKVASGGIERDFNQTFAYMLGTTVDTGAAGLWENGTFLVNLLGISGGPLYQKVGDFQASSNIDGLGVDTFTVYEAWYEHSFMDGDLSILSGLHEYNSEFYVLDYAMALTNSSFGFGPDVSQVGNSTWPMTALTARIRIQPTDNSYGMFAVYDGVPGDPEHLAGTNVILRQDDGLFYAMEWGVTSTEEETLENYYKLAVGGWYRSTDYTDYSDRERANNGGGYIIGEKKIFAEEDSAQGLGVFGQLGFAPGNRNTIAQYTGLGLHYTGLFGCRDEDITTLGVAIASHGSHYTEQIEDTKRSETAIELSYRALIDRGVTIQPDIQYIVNPGMSSSVDNALVVGTRVEVVF